MFRHGIQTIDAHAKPEMNTTPLIDVMLVLLMMFLVALPVTTHEVPVDLPAPAPGPVEAAPSHRLDILPSGALLWDGAALADAELAGRLEALAANRAQPRLEIATDGAASYDRVDRILARIARARVTRIGFVGHRAFAAF